jgi:hypothetical protein
MRRLAIVIIAALITAPRTAHAQTERVWLMLGGGAGRYDMSALNRDIDAYNQSTGGSTPSFPLVHKGSALAAAAGFETPTRWNFGIGLDRLYAPTKASDANGAIEYQFTANGWRAFGEYALRPIGSSTLRFGAGAGIVGESGKLVFSSPNAAPEEFRIRGCAPLYEAYVGGDVYLGPQFALTVAGGYRYAKLGSIKIEGGTLITSNGEATSVEYSGAYVRLGVKLIARPFGTE